VTELRLPDLLTREPRRLRFAGPRALALGLLALGVLLSSTLVLHRGAPATKATFLDAALGAPSSKAPLVRKPARGVTVRLGHHGYSVAAPRQGTVTLSSATSSGEWTRFARGVSRPTAFGRETVTVGPDRTEEFLAVSKRQGLRTWQWRLRSTALAPRLNRDGSISLSRPDASPALRIAPVRILGPNGANVTPAGARWALRHSGGSWLLRLRLDDRRLPLPYVIDPAVDYPSPLYFSSTTSTETGSWRLLTTPPSVANSATNTTPAANATGYFLFKPGLGNTSSGTPSGSPAGTGFVQDLAGGTGFPAGSWAFTVKTQVPSSTLVTGSAILAIGVWKGTISGNGTFHATQTVLTPTDDPAAQNIRTSLSPVTTTVTYSLPAFNLLSTERLYVEIWRKQVGGINSATAADRQVNLIVNDGVEQIVHPAADDTIPVNSFQVVNPTGGLYFTAPGGTSGTLYYRGSAAGSFKLQDTATDTGSGVAQVTYPLVSKSGWTHTAETVTSGPNFQSSTYSWTAGAGSPGAQAIVAQDFASNSTTGTPITITTDTTAPSAPTVALTSPPAWYTTPSVALTLTDGTDSGSGVDPASRVVQRDEATMTNGVCNAFPGTWSTVVTNPDTTVQNAKCYRYRMLEADRVGNQSAASAASGTAKVDLQPPTQPSSLAFSALTNATAVGSTVYYRPGVSGSFTVTASGSTDAESGFSSYIFPTPATWTVTGTGAARTYSWPARSTAPGTLGIHGRDVAGNNGPDATFTPTPDPTPPTTTDDTATIGSDWKQANQTVTLTPIDALSGVANTYHTTDGSTPTTGSPTGTSISLTADGVYTIRYFSVDRVGNAETVQTAPTQIRIDKTAGTATLGTLPAVIHNGQALTATASDATSGVASVAYYYCTPSPCTPSTLIGSSSTGPSYSVTWSSQPADGTYDIQARVTDNAGNVGASPNKTTTIDNAAPDTTITAKPSDPSSNPSPSFSFSASENGSTFQCQLDAGAFAACTSPKSYSGLADGAHTFSVQATDAAGNTDPTPATYTWTIDATPPDTTITAQPSNPSNDPSPSFSFVSSEQGATFECKLDAGAFAACVSPTALTGLLDGSHTFSVRAIDAVGNVDPTPASYTWTIATDAPDTTITAQPPNPSNNPAPSFSFVSSAQGSTFQCQVDSDPFAPCASPDGLTGLADGSHTFSVQAIDPSGTPDPTPATYTWTVDTAAPDTTITSQPSDPSNDFAPSFGFDSSETASTFECRLDGAGFTSCTSPHAFDDLPDGQHTFSVRATDAAGNTDSTPATYTWTIDTSGVPLTVDEVHYTFTGPTSVAFDWRGSPTDIRYGLTTAYGSTATAHAPDPLPFSSPGPFREVELNGLAAGTTYHYSIGGGRDKTFSTAPTSTYRFDVVADVGSTLLSPKVATVASQVAGDVPSFVLVPGDLTYGNSAPGGGQAGVDQHFNDVMAWSTTAAYMPSWGNHEWDTSLDDLRNYKGRFMLPHGQAVASAPPLGCCGDDWGWFDAGGVRFISYPEHYSTTTVSEWQTEVDPVFAAAQADPNIHFIITYGHEPAYSTGLHTPMADLANALDSFGDRYAKYVLSINGHNHDYERFQPVHGVTHLTTGAATSLETPWVTTDPRLVFRAFHLEHLRVDVSSDGLRIDAVCGPSTSTEDTTCAQGTVLDSTTIGVPPPQPPPAPVLYVDQGNANCADNGLGTQDDPFCTIGAAASRLNPGQTVEVSSGTYPESVTIPTSATAAAPIVLTAAPGASVNVTGGTTGFSISNKSFITIKGFNVSSTSGVGISVQNSSNITISNNHVSYAGQQVSGQTRSGIYLNTVRDSTLSGNTVDHTTSYGIYLNGSTRNLIKGNESFSNAQGFARAASGIRLYNSTSNTVDSNRTHDNEDTGIESFTGANDNLIIDNVSYDNGDHGFDNYASTGQRIFGNTAYHNVTAGINIEGGSTGATISNNVSVDNGIASPRTHSDIRVDNASTTGTAMDYDLAYLTTADTLLIWNSVNYTSLAAFKAATGQELHGIQADPKFVNVAARNFHLLSGSPAIDSADSSANGQSGIDFEGNSRVDDPRTPDTGAGPRSYYDRGAYEFQSAALDHIVVSPAAPTMQAGGSQAFTAQGFDPAGNSFGDVTGSTIFGIAPDGSCSANVCTATRAGPHTVTASDQTTDSAKTDAASLLVTAAVLDHLALSPAAATIVSTNQQAYTAEGRDAYDNSLGDVTSTTTFSIGPNGHCTGASCTASAAGPHTVTGTKAGKTGTASLQVIANALDHIVISPSSATITAGGSKAYTAQGFDTSGNSLGDVTAGTTFFVSPDGSCTGNVCTATTTGAHTVTGNNGGKTSTASLTVNVGTLDHLVLSPSSPSIMAGGSQAFTAQGRDLYDNSLGNVTGGTTFSIEPDGSCSGSVCTATTTGIHTVTGTNGGATGTTSLEVDAAALDHLVLTPASASITVGNSETYTAEGRDLYGNSTGNVTASTAFAIDPEGSCSGPTCTVNAPGAHTVTASDGGATGTASLDARTVDHIVISPSDQTITAGGSLAFTAEGFDAAGNSLGDVTSTTTFTIGPDGSCTLNVCTATPAWPHTVTAEKDGARSSTNLFVTPAALDHLVLTSDPSSIAAGGSATFQADGRDRFGNSTGDVTDGATFSIAPDGSCSASTCTASVAGSHTVTATYAGTTGTYSLDVTAATLDHLVLSPASATISAGGSQAFTAEASDAYGNPLGDVTGAAAFSIGPDGSCVFNSCGASAAGPHTVTASFSGATGTASLTVVGSDIDHIVISPSTAAITAGGSQSYTVEAFDASGNSLGDATSAATFSIAPNGSCTANVCTATAAGAHTVTANVAGKTDVASLTVNAGSLDHLVLSPATATITAGGSQAYTAEGRDQFNNSLGDVTSTTTFTIAPNGSCSGATCTASVAGAHTVTGTKSGKTGTASLQVNTGSLDHIVISPASATIAAGGSQSYTAQGFDAANNSLGNVTGSTTFTIAPDGSCTAASCTATVAGAHTVTGNDAGKTSTASLTVNAGALDHLALSPASATISPGGSQAYTAEGRDQFNNSLGDVTSTTTFTIAPNGSCSGASCTASVTGAHTVTGTKSGKTGTASLQVSSGTLDHIVISPSSATVTAGVSQTYTAQAFDAANNSLGDVTASTTFSILPDGSCSANVCTATVAGSHTVTGNDGGKTSTGSLTVNAAALDHLVLSPASATITAGGSQAYTAQARDRYENSLGDATSNTIFTISPNGSCAASLCSATVSGAHTVTGTLLGATGTASLQVNTGPLDHIVISPASATVVAGTSQTYSSEGFDSFNNSLGNATSATTFTISPDGSCVGSVCTPVAGGSHTVTGTDAGKVSRATLNADFVKNGGFETDLTGWNTSGSGTGVTLARVAGGHSGGWAAQLTNTNTTNQTCLLNDSPNWAKTTAAGTYTASLWVRADRSGAPLKLRFREYTADNVTLLGTATASVTLTGSWQQVTVSYTVTSPGSTLDVNAYLASADAPPGNCFYADDASVVLGVPLDHITISPASATITAGGSQSYTAQGFDAANNSLGDVTAATSFSIAPNGFCTGNVCTASTPGAHTVTGNDGGKTSTASLSVVVGPLDHLVLSPASATITAGGSQGYTAQGYDSAGNSLGDMTSTTTFTIAPDGSCTGATCTATTSGAHTVTGTKTGKTGSASLTVNAAALDHLVLSPSSSTIVAGGAQTYSADGRDQYGNSLGDVTASTTFTIAPNGSCSGPTCVVTVAGAHTVTGTKTGKTGTASLNVTAGSLDHLALSPASASISAGGSQAYTADGRDQYDNSLGDVTASTSFTIAPNGSCTGATCTASVAGAHTVTGTKTGKSGAASLTVNAAALDHLVLSPASATISAGGAQAYTAEGRDQFDNSLGDVTSSTTFTIAPNGSCSGATCTASVTGAHTVTGTDSGKTGTASLQVNSGTLDHIVISPASATINAGGSQAYTAQGFDAANNSLGDVTASTSFTISPDGSCSGASCTASAPGAHTVTGNDGGKTSTASLSVVAGPLDHLVLSPASATISAGASQPYTAEGFDSAGNSLGDVTSSTTFTIAPNGSCTGASCTSTTAGAHTVTGTKSGKTGTASLTVNAAALDHLVLSPASATIAAGGSQPYTADGRDQYDNSLGDVTATTTFTIAPNGSCTGASCTATTAGAHTVTGTKSGKTGTASLTVNGAGLDHLVLSPATATITAGGSQSYTADGRDQYGNSLGDVTGSTAFSIAPNGSCVASLCSASTAGAHTVTGTAAGKTGTASLSVLAGSLDHIAISPASATIPAGGSQAYTAEGFDSAGNSLGDVTASTSFTISPDGSCTSASCTASALGSHTVTGNDGGKTSTASLSVVVGALDHLVLSPGSATITAGGSQAYTAEGFDSTGHSLGDVTATTTFTIAPDGSCTGATCTASVVGAHTVTGTKSGKTGTASLTVSAGQADHIVISPATATITAGGSQTYTAQSVDAGGNVLGDVTSETAFSIAPNGSCTANVCTATVSGAHTVTGTDGPNTSNASLTVNAAALDHLTLSPASATITAGGSQAYTAEGFDQYSNSVGDITAATTFTIAPNGSCSGATCTASVTGAHTVTGTDSGKTATASLQVSSGGLDHIVISPASATITAGGSQSYTAEGFDASNNSLGDVTAVTSFSVAPNGSCTGNSCTATAAGAHTVTGSDAGKTSTASLTVNAAALDHLALSPASATITAGGSQAYTAQGRDQFDNSLGDVTSSTTFTIAPNGSCTGATCTASTTGAHAVTGTDSGKTGTASLQVNAGSLDHLTLSPANATIQSGASQSYTATGFDQFNNTLGDVTAGTTFSIAPDGSCAGNACTATVGGVHTVTGTNAGKSTTATLGVNFVKNFGFESDLTGWNTSGSGTGITLARVAGGHSGGWAAQLTNTNTTNQTCLLNDSPNWARTTTAGTYTARLWVRADRNGASFKLRFREYTADNVTLLGTSQTQVALTTSWQQVTVSYTVTSPGSTLDLNAFLASADAPPGNCFYADDAEIYKG
jgi:parallel beta-helix repeat protein